MTTPDHAQSGLTEQGKLSVEDEAQSAHRRDWLAGPASGRSDTAGQTDFGDLKNSRTTHWKVQER